VEERPENGSESHAPVECARAAFSLPLLFSERDCVMNGQNRWRVRQRGRQEIIGHRIFAKKQLGPFPTRSSRQFVPGDEGAAPRRWAGGGGVFVPTPFAQRREARHSQNRLRSDPSSIDSQPPDRPRWSDIRARAGLSTKNHSIATCNEIDRANGPGVPAKTPSGRV